MTDLRARTHAVLQRLNGADPGEVAALLSDVVTEDSAWHVCAPIETLTGADAIAEGLIIPLKTAFPNAMRRDDIAMMGQARGPLHPDQDQSVGRGVWFATLGHLVGNFEAPFLGIPPSGKLHFLRRGEFYRVTPDGRIAEAHILIDVLDLLLQVGRFPLPHMLGTEMMFPAPATHDGVLPAASDRSEASVQLVEAMLRDLHNYDPGSFDSTGQTGKRGYWHPNMLWYGPAGIGSNFTYPGFVKFHREAFLKAFPDRKGGNHFARFGDGDYVASGGWPSMTMTHAGPYLGQRATGTPMSLRVMDFWRCQDGQIHENWGLLDYIQMIAYMGRD
ncbi:MAG: ester cyclase, partial [Pseudomonadota bacterium]